MVRPTRHPKTGIYRIRKAVPAPLRPLAGRREWVENLGTRDAVQAKALASAAIARIEAQHAAILAQHRGEARPLSAREVAAIVGEWRREAVAAVERSPGRVVDREAELDALLEEVSGPAEGEHAAPWRQDEGREFLPGPDELAEADALIRSRGVAADPASVRQVAERLFVAKVEVAHLGVRRASGDWSPDREAEQYPEPAAMPRTPQPDPATVPSASSDATPPLPAKELLDAWAAEAQPSAATRKAYAATFRQVSRILGFDDVRRITADDVVRFKSARLAEGKDPGTVADNVLAAGAVCNWATKNRLLPGNPFAGLAPKVNRRGPAPRVPYDDGEAARILTASRGEDGWLRWLPWLLCFTGARIGEIAELRRGDVRQEDGVWLLDVRPTDQREGKNATFQRLLPLHPAVIAEGFLGYVASLPTDPAGPLFPSIPPDPRGSRVTPATTRLGRWMRKRVGITDPAKAPAHSWRHRMEDELRKVRALPEVQDAITGRHNPRNAGAGYGKGYRGMPGEVLRDLERVPSPLGGAQARAGA